MKRYLKADADTYVIMSNLRSFLKGKNSTLAFTYGYELNDASVFQGYQSGGAGFVLSHEAFKRLSSTILTAKDVTKYCVNFGFGDMDLARCMRMLNVEKSNS